jgi:uncharacterized membrane protein
MAKSVDRKSLKAEAKKDIKGKLGGFAPIYIVYVVVGLVLSWLLKENSTAAPGKFIGAGNLVLLLISLLLLFVFMGVVMVSFARIYLDFKKKRPVLNDIMYGSNDLGGSILTYLRNVVFTFLWSLLLLIPGIVKSLAYSMMYYIKADDAKVSAAEAQKRSIKITTGRKGELFVIYLSFIPWFLLNGITFGLAGFYVVPYIGATLANYYRSIK